MIQAGMEIGPITPYGECINVIKVDLKNTAFTIYYHNSKCFAGFTL